MSGEKLPRKYELRRRAETMEDTRRRITEATVGLHGSAGPSRTTIAAIAEAAVAMDLTDLGSFLKSRRDRVRPQDVGLPTGPRRRVPGLRRDEVAVLAGASAEYCTELEQAAGAQPSEQMLAADVALLGRQAHHAGPRASFVYRWFTDPAARDVYPAADHHHQTTSLTADLRAAVARRDARDPQARRLVQELLRRSPEFADHWQRHDVAVRRDDRKRILHRTLGLLEVNCLNLFSEDGRQRLLWFTPATGTAAVEQFELLAVVGIQELAAEDGPAR